MDQIRSDLSNSNLIKCVYLAYQKKWNKIIPVPAHGSQPTGPSPRVPANGSKPSTPRSPACPLKPAYPLGTAQYFFMKLSWIVSWVSRIDWCEGHWCGSTYGPWHCPTFVFLGCFWGLRNILESRVTVGFWCQTIHKKFLRRFDTIFGLKMMVKSGLEKIILRCHDGLQSCCCPVQRNLPRKAELAWQVT